MLHKKCLFLVAVLLCITTPYAYAASERCSASGTSWGDAVKNFESSCSGGEDRDCTKSGSGWSCSGTITVAAAPPKEELQDTGPCSASGTSWGDAVKNFESSCSGGEDRDCTKSGSGWSCSGTASQNTDDSTPSTNESKYCSYKPKLNDPYIINLKSSGNPSIYKVNGRDVLIKWPQTAVTDPTIKIIGPRHVVSIGGYFRPTGTDNSSQGALEIVQQKTGGISYLERMRIDLTNFLFSM